MLQIFICEDNPSHLLQIEKCVKKAIMIRNLDINIALSTDNPDTLIEYLKKERPAGLYFLDIELEHKMNGMELATIIREYDPRGFIAFITSHDEMQPLTFQYKAEAMDFILKNEFLILSDKITDCILNAHKKYTTVSTELQPNFSFLALDKLKTMDLSKIFYFKTLRESPHIIYVHTTEGMYEFHGSLRDTMKKLDQRFYRCHNSCIINIRHALELDKTEKKVHFQEGRSCPVAGNKMKELEKILDGKETNKISTRTY